MTALFRFAAALTLLVLPEVSLAEAPASLYLYCGGLPGCGPGWTEHFSSVLILAFGLLPAYIYLLGGLFIMIGGGYILLSAGNDEHVTKGKNTIIWTVIGLFVADFAQILVGLVRTEVETRLPNTDLVTSGVNTLIGNIVDLLYIALIGVAVYCGMRMVLARGKEDEFGKARMGLFYAALGAVVINLAEQIVNAFISL